MQTFTPDQLRAAFTAPLPGRTVQYEMAHVVRRSFSAPPPDARTAAVLILLFPKDEQWYFSLIQRAGHVGNDAHRGQIGLPGGKIEADDPSPAYAALREAEEEIGVSCSAVELLGALTELYIPVSNYIVYPFVGLTNQTPTFVPQESEVERIYEVPLRELVSPTVRRTTDLPFGERLTLQNVPYFHLQDKVVWGATAMILNEWVVLLRRANEQKDAS